MKKENIWLTISVILLIIVLCGVGYFATAGVIGSKKTVIDETDKVINMPSPDNPDVITRPAEDYENDTKPVIMLSSRNLSLIYGYDPYTDVAGVSVGYIYKKNNEERTCLGTLKYLKGQRIIKGGFVFDNGVAPIYDELKNINEYDERFSSYDFIVDGIHYKGIVKGGMSQLLMDIDELNIAQGLKIGTEVYKKIDLSNWFSVQRYNQDTLNYETFDCSLIINLVIACDSGAVQINCKDDYNWYVA